MAALSGRKRVKKTTRYQQELFLEYLQDNPNFRVSKLDPGNPELSSDQWDTLTALLNKHGPPSRTSDDWRKVKFSIICRI